MLTLRQKIKLCFYAIGIFVCFGIFALMQEKIFRGRYGEEIGADGKIGERYTMPITFGAVQCIFFVIVAKGLFDFFVSTENKTLSSRTLFSALTYTHNHPKNETSQTMYALTGIFYVLGKVTSHMSLQWVPYPTQIVGKCKAKSKLK